MTHEETLKLMSEGYRYNTKGLLLCDNGPTHVDAVCHINPSLDAPCVDKMPVETFFGPDLCLDVSHVADNPKGRVPRACPWVCTCNFGFCV